MEYIKEDKDTVENVIIFLDGVNKILEGLRDKFNLMIFEMESKSDKPESILHNWVQQINSVIQEKFLEIYEINHSEDLFKIVLKNWMLKFKDNQDFMLNVKVLFKNLQNVRNTIKLKITSNDSLSYVNLTDVLLNKKK